MDTVRSTNLRLWSTEYIEYAKEFYHTPIKVDDAWYSRNFAFCGQDQICCDGTVSNGILPISAVVHMRRLSPHAKCLMIVRDPIERSWSQMRMVAGQRQLDAKQIESLIDELGSMMVAFSHYANIFSKYSRVFGPNAIYIIDYEDIAKTPLRVLQNVCDFFGRGIPTRILLQSFAHRISGTSL